MQDFGGTFVEWEQAKKDAALTRRVADSLAADERRVRDRSRAKANSASEADAVAGRKARKKQVAEAERAVQAAEREVAEVRRQLEDPAVYDGSGVAARRATELKRRLAESERTLRYALERWEGVADS